MWAIEILTDRKWSPSGEGSWADWRDAQAFGMAEVGMPWRVVQAATADMITVSASVEALDGKGGDGAYDLIGDWSPESFCAELLKTLKADWGLSRGATPVPAALIIRIEHKGV